VYWLEVLEESGDLLRVRNITAGAKRPVPQIEAWIEARFVYPLLRGKEVRRWKARPGIHLLLVQDPQTRRGYDPDWLRDVAPHTWDYLAQFESTLRERAAYRRYYKSQHPFYSMFDVGMYSFAPVKVVWQGFGTRRMRAAVITTQAGKPIMTNQAMHPFIGLQDESEAHYLAACLNSAAFEYAVLSQGQVGGKSFAQPGLLRLLRLPTYESANPVHQTLADLSRRAHAGAPDDAAIAEATATIWGLSPVEQRDILQSLRELIH
ncbi:MAG: SAM-dependent DNA methyltransferase, partial [Anaerolineae bacterium]|nr:SAM-dependent DNA methyltransferase [Anaerolineae bacterium]